MRYQKNHVVERGKVGLISPYHRPRPLISPPRGAKGAFISHSNPPVDPPPTLPLRAMVPTSISTGQADRDVRDHPSHAAALDFLHCVHCRLLFKTPGGGVPRHPDFLGPRSRRGQALSSVVVSKRSKIFSGCAGHMGHFGRGSPEWAGPRGSQN